MTVYAGSGPWGPGKGSPLSKAEFDNNNYDFDTRLVEVETNPPQPNDIVAITLTGSFLSMTQRDGTILGPVPFSPPMARWRSEWTVSTSYVAFDFITVTGNGLYGVLVDHTSDATAFDANATDGFGNILYRKVIGFSGSSANIDDLLDVVITSAADKDMLVYDTGSTHWINKTKAQVLANLLGSTSGVLKADGAGVVSAAAAGTDYAAAPGGTANTPLFNDGSGGFTSGTRSGNTTKVATVSGSLTTGNVLVSDASGNLIDGGSTGGGSPAGSSGDIQINSSGSFGSLTPASGIATFLATPSSANLRAALTDEVGTGTAYFVGGALGTPASATLTNATGLPVAGIASVSNLRVIANVSGGAASPSANTMTAILDAVFGSTRGEIISRGASAWGAVSPGKSGYTLQLSSSLDPVWVQVAAGGKGGSTGTAPSNWLLGADYATDAALAANTYSNGSSGVGATLTGNSNGALSVDGSTPSVADRILVKDEASGAHNGVYAVTTVGSGGAAYVLTRATDYDQTTEIVQGSAVAIAGGSANAGTAWVLSTSSSITIGTTALDYDSLTAQLPDLAAGQVLGNSNSFTAPAVSTSLSAIIDQAIASTRGAVLYRGASGWAALSPGTSGYVLASGGAGADPSWASTGGGGGIGDVSGGSTSADGELAAYNGTGGKTVKRSYAVLSGPASSAKTFTLPNASATILTDNAAVTVAQGGTNATSASGTALDNITGFSSTGILKRTGAGAYSFVTAPSGTVVGTSDSQALTNKTIDAASNTISNLPINLLFGIEDIMSNAEETHRFIPPASSFPSGAAGSYGTSGVAAAASTTLTAKKNGVAFATFVWASSGTSATVTISGTTSFNGSSDVLTLEGPATADATLAKIGVTLTGTRS